MRYTKDELRALELNLNPANHQAIINDLFIRLMANKKLSVSEFKFIFSTLFNCQPASDEQYKINLSEILGGDDYLFLRRYIVYRLDLEGEFEILDVYPEPPTGVYRTATDLEKLEAVRLLERHYQAWKLIVFNERFESDILMNVANETKTRLNEIYGIFPKPVNQLRIEKSVILHSKYVYFLIKQYYDEISALEEQINFKDILIIVDSYVYSHCIFRHFGPGLTFNKLSEKTFHTSEVEFENLPKEIIRHINEYFNAFGERYFDSRRIFLEHKGVKKAIWFKRMKSLKELPLIRRLKVSTYYPIDDKDELAIISAMSANQIYPFLIFYIDTYLI